MRIGVVCSGLEVAPCFDKADCLTCYNVEKGVIAGCQTLPFSLFLPANAAELLVQLGVDVLVCGRISEACDRRYSDAGVEVVSNVQGLASQVARDYVIQALSGDVLDEDDAEAWD